MFASRGGDFRNDAPVMGPIVTEPVSESPDDADDWIPDRDLAVPGLRLAANLAVVVDR